jgi:hypothetical protein
MAKSQGPAVLSLDAFIEKVAALDKAAAAPMSEPTTVGGETTHPSKSVDDGLHEVPEGERSKENAADAKAETGPAGVEATGDATAKAAHAYLELFKRASGVAAEPGSAAADHDDNTMTQNPQPTGVDVPKPKAGKNDSSKGGPTAHPARTDNDELGGGKYAYDFAALRAAPLDKLAADFTDLGNELCAALVVESSRPAEKAAAAPAAPATPEPPAAPSAQFQAGAALAGLVGGEKAALDDMVAADLYEYLKMGFDDGQRAADHLDAFLKRASEGDGPPPQGQPGHTEREAAALRHVLGSPWRKAWVPPPPGDLARTADGMAQDILARRRHGLLDGARLGVLADCLEEAGCADSLRLAALRSPGPHYAGFWALRDIARPAGPADFWTRGIATAAGRTA